MMYVVAATTAAAVMQADVDVTRDDDDDSFNMAMLVFGSLDAMDTYISALKSALIRALL